MCPLSDFIPNRAIYNAGLNLNAKSLIRFVMVNGDGQVNGLTGLMLFFAIDPPNIDNDRKGKVVWEMVGCIPRHFFMMWLAVHIRLKTHDTMGVWEKKDDMVCAFCKSVPDSHNHLFLSVIILKSQQFASTLSSHDTCFTQVMFFMHEGLQQARARIYDVPSAIEILLTGMYERLPKRVQGVATLGYQGYHTMWRILHLEVLVGETSGPVKLEEMRRFVLVDDLERRMAASDTPFTTLYIILHEFCVPLIIDTVIRQIQALRIGRWKDVIRFELISDGQG
ncbi:mediator of RNA polymerase II transcription subunit 14 [Tanacetum coccineum]|uniref:Mediator of RNA polymerase II transcription subunit 14 n=1 Tax=Tanacetum coccineum TaxID=301880 RepID=A0ABQ5AZX8_9ASTR